MIMTADVMLDSWFWREFKRGLPAGLVIIGDFTEETTPIGQVQEATAGEMGDIGGLPTIIVAVIITTETVGEASIHLLEVVNMGMSDTMITTEAVVMPPPVAFEIIEMLLITTTIIRRHRHRMLLLLQIAAMMIDMEGEIAVTMPLEAVMSVIGLRLLRLVMIEVEITDMKIVVQ